jgi:hypothetical protein
VIVGLSAPRAKPPGARAAPGAQAIVEVLSQQLRSPAAAWRRRGAARGEAGTSRAAHAAGPRRARVRSSMRPEHYAVGRTLADLNLRGLSGATVLALVRAGPRHP